MIESGVFIGAPAVLVGVVKETFPGEKRVALTPAVVSSLAKSDWKAIVETGAGEAAGYLDDDYRNAGAEVTNRSDVFQKADAIAQVRGVSANMDRARDELNQLRREQMLVGLLEPWSDQNTIEQLARTGVTAFSMELMPRTTRAQAMDVLSSQANIAGYKAVVVAADLLPKLFPMMMTPSGTITPAKVFIIGAGVAGLQAIATAKRLGAVVTAYDVRPVVKEQVESLGATFLEIKIDNQGAEDKGGYAKEMSQAAIEQQQRQMTDAIASMDVVITTALVPGRPAPKLVTAAQVERMKPGSVIVDLASERGGNCELTKPGETIVHNGVTIVGETNLPASAARDSSQMYARNIASFLQNLRDKQGALKLDGDDDIIKGSMLTRHGQIVNEKIRETFGMSPLAPQTQGASA